MILFVVFRRPHTKPQYWQIYIEKIENNERRIKTISNWQRITHAVRGLPPAGHNISAGDENSTEAESATGRNPSSTGMGCYKNYDHIIQNEHRQSNTSQVRSINCIIVLRDFFLNIDINISVSTCL